MVKVTTTKDINPGARAFGFMALLPVLLVLTIWRVVVFDHTGSWLTAIGAFGLSVLFDLCMIKMIAYTLVAMLEKAAREIKKAKETSR